MTFNDLPVNKAFIKALKAQNITEPTEVQLKTIKSVMENRDVIACSNTGTGKTFAYLLPVLSKINLDEHNVQALILVPTPELAAQVNNQITNLFKNGNIEALSVLLIGNANVSRQIEALKNKPVAVVGTPARILQLIRMKKLHVHNVKSLVLDEADKLMDKTYFDNIMSIRKSLMKRTQVLLFSASISSHTIKQANCLTHNPVIYQLERNKKELIPKTIKHIYVITDRRERIETLRRIVKALNDDKTIIFINTKYDLEETLQKLQYHHYDAAALAGSIDKNSRKNVIDSFKAGRLKYLLATDVAARGLQIDHISTVINLNLPEEPTEYLHRAGRCGRNNEPGLCVSIITENELNKIKKYQKLFNINIVQKRLYNGKLVAK